MRYLFILLLFLGLPAHANERDYTIFKTLPVVEDGRIKPLDTLATNLRLRLSESTHSEELSAIEWLAQALFDPARAASYPSFKVSNPHLRSLFELPERSNKLYSLTELAPGLEKTAASVAEILKRTGVPNTKDEQDLLTLHGHVLVYNQLLQSFSLLLPLPFPAPEDLKLGPLPTYLDAQKIEPELAERLSKILTPDKIEQPEKLKPNERALAAFMHGLQSLREAATNNQLLRIIPSGWGSAEWYAPWQLLLQGQGSPNTQELLNEWQKLALAYRAEDAAAWRQASQNARELAYYNQGDSLLKTRLTIEVAYRNWHLYDWALGLLTLGVGCALLSLRGRMSATPALLSSAFAALLLIAAIGLRVFILNRPPVGTLHESVLFVALTLLISAIWLGWRKRQVGLLLSVQLSTILLLGIAPFLLTDSENMTMLSAVLNTNFWLLVHVLCITAGYAACALTAALAHVQLAVAGTAHDQSARIPLLHRCALVALLLTAVGTLLGGVWADQSWGRFWGWDPKENGALIIVLWLLWLLHSRMAGQVRDLAFTAGLAALGVVVAQAWFGVNLLSTGLHSYGFIEGIAFGLFSYTALNLLLIAALWWLAHKRITHA